MPSPSRPANRSSDLASGALAILPIAGAAIPFGVLWGALAAQKGLSPLEALMMSAVVLAGASQFVAIDLWAHPIPIATVVVATFLVNTRHILMGTSLLPKMDAFPKRWKPVALFFLVDEVWALAEKRAREGPLTPAYYAGMAAVISSAWLAWTTLGALLGAGVGDPTRYGFDFAFTALFIGLLMSFRATPGFVTVVVAAAAGSTLVHLVAPGPLAIAAGAVAGVAAATLRPMKREQQL
ncbi:AzlC family ABC transporter permease [Amorphus orientalis]|uniref:4-azaleucine resistance transporter AzlC n=1 Tax=Amorphus orientalis TaxID=649198 RepID=A0AAE3VNG8_9HYPH|nr:AzlC family ABC transporter permease [Amorphus orientalis]MDQ0315271.1 4-azaleucine resistance transporter AzlC [Amorphus orientalis]